MIRLMILLLRQRARRLERQYGWPTALSLGALLMLVLWQLASVVSRLVALGTVSTLGSALAWLWIGWIVTGATTGRDFTWHVRIERLFVFRVPWTRLYVLDLLLGYVSFPLLILALAVTLYGARRGWTASHWAISEIALCVFVLITRLFVSIVRTVLYRGRAFGRPMRIVLVSEVLVVAAMLIIPATLGITSNINPGWTLASIFMSQASAEAVATLLSTAFVLMLVDYAIQRHVTRSGVIRPGRAGRLLGPVHARLLLAGSWPSLLFRVTMLGWLRNRNALLLFLWGTAYGFLYTWFTKANELSYFLSFAWMVLVFHSYLRGNLFGVDQKGVWFYFLLPLPLRNVLRAKSASMTVLQCSMVSAVLIPAVVRHTAGMTSVFAWVCVIGFSASALLVSDIAGQLFSVLHPDPIERGALYSGGMTLGAFVIPTIHVVLAVLYLVAARLTPRFVAPGAAWSFFVGLPIIFAVIRWKALSIWVDRLLARDREEILLQLAAVTP